MKKSRMGIILGVLALMIVTAGCSSLVSGKWAVKVNEEPILVEDYDARVTDTQKIYENLGMKFDTEEGKPALLQIKNQLLDFMIQGKIMAQEVKNLKLNPEDAKVKELIDILKKDNNIKDDVEFQNMLKQQGMTEPELKNFLTVYENVTGDMKVNDADVKAFYDENIAYYTEPESVTARHILVKTEDEAKAIIVQLNAGADFGQLAKEKSTDAGSKESGGDVGTFTKGKMVPEFETAAFAQKVGTFSADPVKTEFGYHVIKVEAHTDEKALDYAKEKDRVEQDALNQAKDAKFQTYFNDLRKKAKIEYSKGYQPVS